MLICHYQIYFGNFEKISAKESCLYGIICIRITPFLEDGF